MLQIQMRILRVFGPSREEMAAIVKTARAEGCPSLRVQVRDGEYTVCIQASAPTQTLADEYCEWWVQKLSARFGDTCYGFEDTSLAQASLDALLTRRRLLVAADEVTGEILGGALRGLEHSEAVFDFGNQTYRSTANSRRIVHSDTIARKYPGDPVQNAAGLAQSALSATSADYAAVYCSAGEEQDAFVLLCSRIGAAACAVEAEASDGEIANHILDLARRRALGMHLRPAAVTFRPGRDHPPVVLSSDPRPGTRYIMRRKSTEPKGAEPEIIEPEEIAAPAAPEPPEMSQPPEQFAFVKPEEPDLTRDPASPGGAPTGTITFEVPPEAYEAEQPDAAPDSSDEWPHRVRQEPEPDVSATRTIKINRTPAAPEPALPDPEEPADYRGAAGLPEEPADSGRMGNLAPGFGRIAAPGEPEEPEPFELGRKGSLLDREVPDFSAGLDPRDIEAARRADAAEPGASVEEFQRAASNLFAGEDDDEDDDGEWTGGGLFPGMNRSKKPKAGGRPFSALHRSKLKKVSLPMPTFHKNSIQNRSLAMIERSERRRRRNTILAVAAAVVLIVIGASLLLNMNHESTVSIGYELYGTEQFDTEVAQYLAQAAQHSETVTGYLAFPGQNGQLVYTGSQPGDGAALTGGNYLSLSAPANTVLTCADGSLTSMTNAEILQANPEFTLYLNDTVCRFTVTAVYYADSSFSPLNYGSLSSYYEYLAFTTGIAQRSLFDTGTVPGDSDSFVTLVSTGGENGAQICVTGILDKAQS